MAGFLERPGNLIQFARGGQLQTIVQQTNGKPSDQAQGRQCSGHKDQDQAAAQRGHCSFESAFRPANWTGADATDQRSCWGREGRLKISISVARLMPEFAPRGSLDSALRISRRAQSCWPAGRALAGTTMLSRHQDSALDAERRIPERRKSRTRTTENFSSQTS